VNNLPVIEKEKNIKSEIQSISLNCTDDLSVQKLLDTMAVLMPREKHVTILCLYLEIE
jgi:alkyl hydroperoxide reductase subunit AhpF